MREMTLSLTNKQRDKLHASALIECARYDAKALVTISRVSPEDKRLYYKGAPEGAYHVRVIENNHGRFTTCVHSLIDDWTDSIEHAIEVAEVILRCYGYGIVHVTIAQ